MFLNKIRNIFCVPDTKFVSATNIAPRANGETFVSATMCPQQCVLVCQGLNNGFTTQPFAVERGVRQGDPSALVLFIMVLEILRISIRNNKDIHGLVVDNEELY